MSSTSITRSSEAVPSQYGPVFLRLEFRRDLVSRTADSINIQPQQVREFTITLDMNNFLPSFHLIINDSAGMLTHLVPFDRDLSRLHVQVGNSTNPELESTTDYSFDVYRRFPRSDFIYDIEGLLAVGNLFSPKKCRGFSGNIKTSLESIGEELGVTRTEISNSLGYSKSLLQPGWSNAMFLNYLKQNLSGISYESAFYSFIKCVQTDTVFVFKSVRDFVGQTPKYYFTLCMDVYKDVDSGITYYPIVQYKIVDNYKLIGVIGAKRTSCVYFDYDESTVKVDPFFVDDNEDPRLDYRSFTQFHLIDNADAEDEEIALLDTGRTNDFAGDFKAKVLNSYHKNITDLSKIWIDTLGIEDVYPGDMVLIQFLEHEVPDNKFGYQYQGFWMVEKVVHVIGRSYLTRLLLTRNGSDATGDHNLLKAANWKKK